MLYPFLYCMVDFAVALRNNCKNSINIPCGNKSTIVEEAIYTE